MDSQDQETPIELQNVTRIFQPNTGVFDLDLCVPAGTIVGLIGPSGSGKTTTVRLMLGLLKPDTGEVTVLGETPTQFSKRTRERIGYMPQQFVLYPNLTVQENLRFVASLYGMGYFSRRGRLEEVLQFVELADVRDRLGGQLSGGMQRRLELACSLVHDPLLLFADEPTAGIDPVLRSKFWAYFRELRDEGRTLFITTQYVGEAAYCDLVGVMREGRLVLVDTPEELRRKALGGEVIKIAVDQRFIFRAAQVLQRQPGVSLVRVARDEAGGLYVHVDDAGEALPGIIQALNDHPDIVVKQAEEYLPPFDDVFVMLMRQMEQTDV